jgi:NAD(P)-dependent dehydrogenase (short-subunit alcohol dehydrogenase family)
MIPDVPVVMVTGASKGMGREITRWLATAGAAVVPAARSEDALEGLAQWIRSRGATAIPICLDVSDRRECEAAVQKAVDAFGRIDGLVNNAGVLAPLAPLASADPAQWQRNISVNLLGPFFLIRAALFHLRKTNGRVVNISTGAAEKAIEGWSAYCASKAAVAHMTRVLAAEEHRITALSFRPGVVDTDMQALIRREGPEKMTPEKNAYFQDLKSKGMLAPPAVPAREAAWLALHAPSAWSGELIETGDPRIGRAPGRGFPVDLEK